MRLARATVISASRRTDIPAFYMPWFMQGVARGSFEVINPYNGLRRAVAMSPQSVHTIVFWSKNFGPFIRGRYAEALENLGYHLFFNFTVNSENKTLEPHVPPLADRLAQLTDLCIGHDPRSVVWRFDPICLYRHGESGVNDNLSDFEHIARGAARCGVQRCITSFRDDYAKIRKRTAAMDGFAFVDPPMESKVSLLLKMTQILKGVGIALYTCCEAALMAAMPANGGVGRAACIPNDLLMEIYGGRLSLQKDRGQRVRQGCGCMQSTDIGSYRLHPCAHNCLFCYANPVAAIDKVDSGVVTRKPVTVQAGP